MPAAPVSSATAPVFTVDIPLLPESAAGHALQFIDLLRGANLLAGLRLGAHAPRLAWRLLDARGVPLPALPGPLGAYAGGTPPTGASSSAPAAARHTPDAHGSDARACALFLPPLHAADIPAIRAVAQRHRALSRQVGQVLDSGRPVFTLGNAAWLAAHSGRLAGRRVALPWFYVAGFERDFPDTGFTPGQAISEDGLWISAALPAQVSELAVALVRRTLGPALAEACASVLVADPERTRAAQQANAQHHIPATRDSTLARAIAWMEAHLDQPYSLQTLAEAAAVSPRTLLRHFQQELSQSPLDHLHSLRCARAKVLLEVTLESVPSIAVACGYADPAAFRRIFVRHTGMAPAEYRKRHTLRAPRKRWRVDVR
ncbi:GlxA family transcriptional regulator [Paracidovorax sp. MALMAid1276]|uniref:GlxA family transcriptional regulator n=1 Tax=Paracidovorax sp. MALMAid1276 TaxID=3411631 RepID=UPI003B9C7A31